MKKVKFLFGVTDKDVNEWASSISSAINKANEGEIGVTSKLILHEFIFNPTSNSLADVCIVYSIETKCSFR